MFIPLGYFAKKRSDGILRFPSLVKHRIAADPRKRARPSADAFSGHVSPPWCDESEPGVAGVRLADL
ncbi:uncharacterized protein PpBr36_11419 [Pyricularia pennisetigena]|uniref:uncharacterized protein n=1 Tax=Pyricularia pennisetigena TaxID=1578925 RepID=UPI001152017A|nr:uncharacterized protein PpBr36_11419 [Pyricularia pennisetigena]TLS20281.1 hypothetical protein PpBr36_11419 [Pyricularia pennisetigena]